MGLGEGSQTISMACASGSVARPLAQDRWASSGAQPTQPLAAGFKALSSEFKTVSAKPESMAWHRSDATQEVPKMKTSHMHTLCLTASAVALSLSFGVAHANGTSNSASVDDYAPSVAGVEPYPEGYDGDLNQTLEPTAAGYPADMGMPAFSTEGQFNNPSAFVPGPIDAMASDDLNTSLEPTAAGDSGLSDDEALPLP
jgi:hypothetical protein